MAFGGTPMSCTELLRTQAFLDGELDDRAGAEAEAHMRDCPECQNFSASTAELSDALHRGIRHRAPEALRARVAAALDAEEHRKFLPFRRNGARGFWAGAVSGVALSALAAGFAFVAVLPPPADSVADAVADAHTRALMQGQTIQVVSTNHHTVKPWFAGRVPLSPPVADFASQGFALAGGRVDEVPKAQAAVVVYRHGAHEIDLFVWADRGSPLPQETTRHGYHAVFWKKADLDFAAVSDMDPVELHRFVGLVRSERE
jgi:anti-sigma factor RsiW